MSWSAVAQASIDLYHLQLELQRIDLRLKRAIGLWQMAGQDPGDAFRGLYVSDEQAHDLLNRPIGINWGHTATLPPELTQQLDAQVQRIQKELTVVRADAQAQGHVLPLDRICTIFGLSQFELDVLLLAVASSIDLRYEKIFGYLQDDVTKKAPTVNLALDLFANSGIARLTMLAHFRPPAPLVQYRLVEIRPPQDTPHAPLLAHILHVDTGILTWLLGHYQPEPSLAPFIERVDAPPDLAEDLHQGMPAHWDRRGLAPIYALHGPDEGQQRAAAASMAQAMGKSLLILNLPALVEAGHPSPDVALRLLLRDALLIEALPMVSGWDACLHEDTPHPPWLALVLNHPEPVVLTSKVPWQPRGLQRRRPVLQTEFPIPSYARRRILWSHFLGPEPDIDPADIDAVAGQFELTSDQIRDAVSTTRDMAFQQNTGLTRALLFAGARACSNTRLARLAHKITPRYGWDDIILPEDQRSQLREIINTVRGRPRVLDEWGVAQKLASSRGVTVLFAGPPGTGKTMAAEIIAGELELDLYRIDLSTIVSKYIGETEKNIERVFAEAEQSNAILFFDEADALFGKRSEVRDSHDRYANIEISYLLQRMEAYDGVTILATNLRGNLDEAFTRRLQFAVSFPFPEVEDRLRIWKALFPSTVPRDPDIDFEYLAERFRLAGGNIRNIIISAAYLAAANGGRVTMEHLLHSTRRELQKMGRLVTEEDLSPPSAT